VSAELVAIARFVPVPAARDRVLAALERVTVATQSEPGCLLVALHAGEDGDFLQIGKWESLDPWRAHGEAASVRQLDREVEGLLRRSERSGGSGRDPSATPPATRS